MNQRYAILELGYTRRDYKKETLIRGHLVVIKGGTVEFSQPRVTLCQNRGI